MTAHERLQSGEVAVIGFACRFPQAPTADAFWTLLHEGRDAVTEVPPQRWDWRACYDADPTSGRKTNSRWGGFLDGIEDFDAWFFNIAPREARLIDPQQRLLLEVAWEALEHAGHAGDELAEGQAGVFVGCSNNGYYARIAPALLPSDYSAGIANQNAVVANRVSFFLNLRGPSVLVDTMCSSSLVAIHLACQSVRAGECTMALAGGVNVLLSPEYYVAMSRMKAHAPDGRCKTFDHRANGIVLGEGAGVVVLKPLARAIEDRDTIHAVIRGSAVNHGGQANGLSAPNPQAQADLIRSALRAADVAPDTISYVEAHGTGTALGDPVEVEGLIKAFGPADGRAPWCRLGSVKTNIGHLECAAGISAFIKVLLAMRHRELPSLLHFEKPNPLLHLSGTPFRLMTALEPWTTAGPLRAGVSSFGIAGTNAHVVVEEPPAAHADSVASLGPHLIALSAKTGTALAALRSRYAEFLEGRPTVDLRDMAYTLQSGRSHFPHRWATVCESFDELLVSLRAAGPVSLDAPPEGVRIAFLFPDHDGQHVPAVGSLDDAEPAFRSAVDRVDRVLSGRLRVPLRDLLLGQTNAETMRRTVCRRSALFALEVALAELWRSWNVMPDEAIGNGVGECAAAYVSGAVDLETAADLVVTNTEPIGSQSNERAALRVFQKNVTASACNVFLEVGPRTRRFDLPRDTSASQPPRLVASFDQGRDPRRTVLEALATLYCAGLRVRWEAVERSGRRIPLPGYPFERRRHWIDTIPALPGAEDKQDAQAPVDTRADHPLLGARIGPCDGPVVVFENLLAADRPAFLEQHRVGASVLFPATGFFELAVAAGARTLAGPQLTIEDLILHSALRLDTPRRLQTVVVRSGNNSASFQCLSAESNIIGAAGWTLHASGRLGLETDGSAAAEVPSWEEFATEEIDVDGHYADLRRRGFDLGPLFRGLRSLRRVDTESTGVVEWPGSPAEATGYTAHPALMDACLHVLAATFSENERRAAEFECFVPVGCARLALRRPLRGGLRVSARQIGEIDAEGFTGDVRLFDSGGMFVGMLAGLRLRRIAARNGDTADADHVFHEVRWVPALEPPSSLGPPGRVLLFADATGIADAIAARLEARGLSCVRVRPGTSYTVGHDGSRAINPARPEDARLLFAEPFWSDGPPLRRVIHLWTLDVPSSADPSDDDIQAAQALACGSLLHVVQALISIGAKQPPRLCVVTHLGQATGIESRPLDFFQSLPWGLGRAIALEHPELRPMGVDIDGIASIEALVAEVLSDDLENQVCLRNGSRRVARLARVHVQEAGEPPTAPVRLEATEQGVLDQLAWRPTERRSPGPGEVEIHVEAAGLNFRDVLTVLGMYRSEPGPIGGECAGRVTAVGLGVERLAVGDLVVATAPGSFATYVTTPAQWVARRPSAIRAEEAATIPVAFLTAAYALETLGELRPGERVLIHAGAGGVGLAAVQIARRAGAEIFASAGSPEKRAFLSSIGVRHVMDSRKPNFVDDVLRATSGRGVDVVLNSLAGEFIPRSLDALGPGGRFLEIGKLDVWSRDRVAGVRPDVRYEVVALDVLASDKPSDFHALFEQIMSAVRDGVLHPLPFRAFARAETADAFRHMAQARHIGKVIVSPHEPRTGVRPDAAYVVTGGLGALGLHLARSLVDRGARHLTLAGLVGREELSLPARATIDDLESRGVSVRIVKADVSHREDVRRLLNAARADGRPLAGVVHAAGTLDDGVVRQLTYDRLERVLAPKVAAAVHLHALTSGEPLDFLVFFSSMIGILGSPGQANYASANAFLDALAHHRHALGLPALSIDWGPWSQGGMADQGQSGRRWTVQGITPLRPDKGLAIFWRALTLSRAQIGVLPIDWGVFATSLNGETPPLLTDVCSHPAPTPDESSAVLKSLENVLPSERRRVLVEHLRKEAAAILGLPSTQRVDPRLSFLELGMDSLTAVEFRNRLFRSLGHPLAPTLIFDHPTLDALSEHLARDVFGWEKPVRAAAGVPAAMLETPDDLEMLLAQVESLSEETLRSLTGQDNRQ